MTILGWHRLTARQTADIRLALTLQLEMCIDQARRADSIVTADGWTKQAMRYLSAFHAVAGARARTNREHLLAELRDRYVTPSRKGIRRD